MSVFPLRSCIQQLLSHNVCNSGAMLRPLALSVRWRTNTSYSSPFYSNIPLNQAYPRQYSTGINSKDEKVNVGHATFLAEAKRKDSWESKLRDPRTEDESELEGVKPGKGKLQPTSSHLFKVILPLATTRPPIVFLLHPSQPLSHLARLIASALPKPPNNIYFCAASDIGKENTRDTEDSRYTLPELGGEVQWADSTDIGDFTKSAARSRYFHIVIEEEDQTKPDSLKPRILEVAVPTFERRTIYLKRRLQWIRQQRQELDNIKVSCDAEARRSAKRLAFGGLGIMVTYWVAIFRLTFWDYGWNIIEPVSYLSGLSMIILGYSWFLYQGREVSYSSIMDRSISKRRSQLYESKGFDLDRWSDLVAEEKVIKREISRIAQDYGLEWGGAEAKKDVKREEKRKQKQQEDAVESEEEGEGSKLDEPKSRKG